MVNWIGLGTFVRREVERMLRVMVQTLVTPWISALLYIFIFGFVVGRRIDPVGGIEYIDFVLPGILMMNVISSAFSHTSSSVYFARFVRHIEEVLVAPFSHMEMVVGYVTGGVARAVLVGAGIFAIALAFGAARVAHFWTFVLYLVGVSVIFSLVGILVGLWANSFEQLGVLNTFVIMPFSFLGGVFYSIEMLPERMRAAAALNPFFHFIDGFRYAMTGLREGDGRVGAALLAFLAVGLFWLVIRLFRSGWRLRE